MKIYGARRIRCEDTVATPVILHASLNYKLRKEHPERMQFHYVQRKEPSDTHHPRITFIITSEGAENKYDYESIEIRFNYNEARQLEAALARALRKRTVREGAGEVRQVTRIASRDHLIGKARRRPPRP